MPLETAKTIAEGYGCDHYAPEQGMYAGDVCYYCNGTEADHALGVLRDHLTALEQELAEAREALNRKNALTCVYCGQAYAPGTPTHGTSVLTEHIRVCPQHPLRAAESDLAVLRSALVRLVGADTRSELEAIEGLFRAATLPEADKTAIVDAIHALLPGARREP
jgi:hypothetical protein